MPTPGQRVVLRYLLPADSSHPMTDVLGILQSLEPVVVQDKHGALTTVDPDRVVALKAIPPRPVRTRDVREVEHAAACAWPGLEHQWLGDWLLRAGAGFTRRANSVLPLGPPEGDDPLAQVLQWYAERALPARFQLPDRLSVDLPGWQHSSEVLLLTAELPADNGPDTAATTITSTPVDAWLQGYPYRGGPLPAEAPAVLAAVLDGELGFGRIEVDGETAAIVRGSLTRAPDGTPWLGITSLYVAEHRRHTGLGTQICAAIIDWGRTHGAQRIFLQVSGDNEAALALYRGLGFTEHHRYHYASPPGPG